MKHVLLDDDEIRYMLLLMAEVHRVIGGDDGVSQLRRKLTAALRGGVEGQIQWN